MSSQRPDDLDKATVAKIINGDADAYADIMARYEAKLHRYVVYLIHNNATANDVVQDTFIKAYQNLQGFNGKYKFSSWIYRIAHNEAMNAVKKMRHITDDDINELPDVTYSQGIEELMDEEALRGRVRACLNGLEPKYREVIQLVYFERMKYEEVSDILHVPASTIGVWLSRAKKLLKEICQQKGVRR
ncbi:RNA polymerase sigma factor [Candidatus Saccharibacteria bacterium]|nr:RNA polymerase sigma factor [Candidatus Saccharibacteria bacterium]